MKFVCMIEAKYSYPSNQQHRHQPKSAESEQPKLLRHLASNCVDLGGVGAKHPMVDAVFVKHVGIEDQIDELFEQPSYENSMTGPAEVYLKAVYSRVYKFSPTPPTLLVHKRTERADRRQAA